MTCEQYIIHMLLAAYGESWQQSARSIRMLRCAIMRLQCALYFHPAQVATRLTVEGGCMQAVKCCLTCMRTSSCAVI
jgi:hypothetical protein